MLIRVIKPKIKILIMLYHVISCIIEDIQSTGTLVSEQTPFDEPSCLSPYLRIALVCINTARSSAAIDRCAGYSDEKQPYYCSVKLLYRVAKEMLPSPQRPMHLPQRRFFRSRDRILGL